MPKHIPEYALMQEPEKCAGSCDRFLADGARGGPDARTYATPRSRAHQVPASELRDAEWPTCSDQRHRGALDHGISADHE
jgi:hypothetical protein